jgi:uncharacterized protein (TIGR00725 family)
MQDHQRFIRFEESRFRYRPSDLKERADSSVRIISDIAKEKGTYDLILSNLVLCECLPRACIKVMADIRRLLKDDGHVLLSVCNPAFDDLDLTETRRSGFYALYSGNFSYKKLTTFGWKKEVHHPSGFYPQLFEDAGFEVVAVHEDDGVDLSTLNNISEHVIYELKKAPIKPLIDCTLLIKVCAMDADIVYSAIRQIVHQLEKGCRFVRKIVIEDLPMSNRNRRYNSENGLKLGSALEMLVAQGTIDDYRAAQTSDIPKVFHEFFARTASEPYSANGQPIFTEAFALNLVRTRYVFQTDIDIAYFGNDHGEFLRDFEAFKKSKAVTGALSILHHEDGAPELGKRTEIRNCFFNLPKLKAHLPLQNPIRDRRYTLPLHRAIDQALKPEESIRFHEKGLGFVHLPNTMKGNPGFVSVVLKAAEDGLPIPPVQYDQVDLQGQEKDWVQPVKAPLVVFSRGRDTTPSQIRRLFLSLSEQQSVDFKVVYIDDGSQEDVPASDYWDNLKKWPWFHDHVVFYRNCGSMGSLANFSRALEEMIVDPSTIVVNVDGDDALLDPLALKKISDRFATGADLTVGNCFRLDKPLRHYQVESFQQAFRHDGDNIWCHPKCFRRYLYGAIGDFLKDDQGHFIDVSTDYAMMLPLVDAAKHPEFIDEPLYLFDPSSANKNQIEQYGVSHKKAVRDYLFQKAERRFMKPIITIIGDATLPPTDPRYQIAYQMGQVLVDAGYRVQTGGMGGVMEAAFKGAHVSKAYEFGDTIAILPGLEASDANPYADIKVTTGMDHLRAEIVVNTTAVIAIGGGSGTLEEMAVAWQLFRLMIAFKGVEGWSGKIADTKIDPRIRYENLPEDRVYGVTSPLEALALIQKYASSYTRVHTGISKAKKKN